VVDEMVDGETDLTDEMVDFERWLLIYEIINLPSSLSFSNVFQELILLYGSQPSSVGLRWMRL